MKTGIGSVAVDDRADPVDPSGGRAVALPMVVGKAVQRYEGGPGAVCQLPTMPVALPEGYLGLAGLEVGRFDGDQLTGAVSGPQLVCQVGRAAGRAVLRSVGSGPAGRQRGGLRPSAERQKSGGARSGQSNAQKNDQQDDQTVAHDRPFLSAFAHLTQGGVDGKGEPPGRFGREVRHEPGAGTAHFLDCQLDPEVVAGLAVVQGGDGPRHLGPLGVVGRVVVAPVVSEPLHRAMDALGPLAAVIRTGSLAVTLDHVFRPDRDVVGVLARVGRARR